MSGNIGTILPALVALGLLCTVVGFALSFRQSPKQRRTPKTYQRHKLVVTDYSQPIRYRASRQVARAPASYRESKRTVSEHVPLFRALILLISALLLSCLLVLSLGPFQRIMPNAVLLGVPNFLGGQRPPSPTASAKPKPTAPALTASQRLVRISQLDPSQYDSMSDFTLWAYSACSTAAMTEVMNAYGRHYRIADVLRVEAAVGAITPALGLTHDGGIADTAVKLGFATDAGYSRSLQQVIDRANSGQPVIVAWPPSRYDGGHLVVVTGGDGTYVYLADSSLYDRHQLTRSQFLVWWAGFSAILTPQATSIGPHGISVEALLSVFASRSWTTGRLSQ